MIDPPSNEHQITRLVLSSTNVMAFIPKQDRFCPENPGLDGLNIGEKAMIQIGATETVICYQRKYLHANLKAKVGSTNRLS